MARMTKICTGCGALWSVDIPKEEYPDWLSSMVPVSRAGDDDDRWLPGH